MVRQHSKHKLTSIMTLCLIAYSLITSSVFAQKNIPTLTILNWSEYIDPSIVSAFEKEYNSLGTSAGFYDDWHEGRDPAGISTQDEELAARFDPVMGGRRLANYLNVLTLETQTLARANGKSHVHNLEPEDLVALTIEAAAMAGVPLAGTDWIPGRK